MSDSRRLKVLITGATGYVGSWTAKAVQDAGHDVRLMVRTPERLKVTAAAVGVVDPEVVVGDISDLEAVKRAVAGCDAVIHAAAAVSQEAGHEEEFQQSNCVGARNVLLEAAAAGLNPIIHVSSASVLWRKDTLEIDPMGELGGAGDPYSATKANGEAVARQLQADGVPVVITYPTAVMGPAAGHHLGDAGDGIGLIVEKRVVPGKGAGMALVDVRDLANAHAALLTADAGGRRYVVGGHHLTGSALARTISELAGRRVMHLPVPNSIMVGFGAFADRHRRWMPSLVDGFTEASMWYLNTPPVPDNTPIERDLGITFRHHRDTLAATIAALRDRESVTVTGGSLASAAVHVPKPSVPSESAAAQRC